MDGDEKANYATDNSEDDDLMEKELGDIEDEPDIRVRILTSYLC